MIKIITFICTAALMPVIFILAANPASAALGSSFTTRDACVAYGNLPVVDSSWTCLYENGRWNYYYAP